MSALINESRNNESGEEVWRRLSRNVNLKRRNECQWRNENGENRNEMLMKMKMWRMKAANENYERKRLNGET